MKLLLAMLMLLMSGLSMAKQTDYLLGAGDMLQILVYQEPELTTTTRINQTGSIVMPLVGKIKLEGVTLDQAKTIIEEKFKDGYLIYPDVTLIVQSYRPFFIHGEVKSPGSYKYQAEISVEQAIALAGGLKDRASNSDWYILRGVPKISFKVTKNEKILPGDVIRIDKGFF